MANGSFEFKEVRFKIFEDYTETYVLCQADENCPIGVQGWHYKVFGKKNSIEDIVKNFAKDDPVLWPQKAP